MRGLDAHTTHPGKVMRAAAVALVLLPMLGCRDREIQVNERPVMIVEETVGNGNLVKTGDVVEVDYTISTMDGRQIQRYDGYRFTVGMGHVVQAMDEAVIGMRKGGRRTVEAAPQKHWGRAGYGEGKNAIPPSTRLIFKVVLRDVD